MSADLVSSLIARLQSAVPELLLVAGAAGFAAASESNPPATPAAYVFITAESGGEGSIDEVSDIQRIESSLSVVLVVRHVGAAAGAGAAGDLQALSDAVKAALRGFAPTAEHDPMRFESAALLAFRDRHEWWQQSWKSACYEGV